MRTANFTIKKTRGLSGSLLCACLLIFAVAVDSFAQYQGAPVKKERLLKALRSKQLQTADIVTVINSNGVDFILTPDVKKALIAAGARPEIISAAATHLRTPANKTTLFAGKNSKKSNRQNEPAGNGYDELLEKALYSYKEQKNPASAVRYLEAAVRLRPGDSKAYQMLGFVNLYGLDNLESTRKYMREAIANGGSAVFRVYHDDSGNFNSRCTGSLYISPEKIRFESDDNKHTFETSTASIEKIKTDTETSKAWKKYPIFKMILRFGKEEAKFRFAPISGSSEESNMAAMFIAESQTRESNGMAMLSPQ